jgi:hypothetical protein
METIPIEESETTTQIPGCIKEDAFNLKVQEWAGYRRGKVHT